MLVLLLFFLAWDPARVQASELKQAKDPWLDKVSRWWVREPNMQKNRPRTWSPPWVKYAKVVEKWWSLDAQENLRFEFRGLEMLWSLLWALLNLCYYLQDGVVQNGSKWPVLGGNTVTLTTPKTSWSFNHNTAQRHGFTRIHAYILIQGLGIIHHFMMPAAIWKLFDALERITYGWF